MRTWRRVRRDVAAAISVCCADADAPWSDDLLADVAAVTTADFELIDARDRDIDNSLDLVAIAVRP